MADASLRKFILSLLTGAALLWAPNAGAVGWVPPVGPSALPRLPDARAEDPATWRVGVATSFLSSGLRFPNQLSTTLEGVSALAVASYAPTATKLLLQVALGGIGTGQMRSERARYALAPGWTGGASISYPVLDGRDAGPFVLAGLGVSASNAFTLEPDGARALRMLDARATLAVGKTFGGWLSPYLVARAFLGNTTWDRGTTLVTGRGRDVYQAGLGVLLRLGRLDVSLEAAPLGEQAAQAGVGFSL